MNLLLATMATRNTVNFVLDAIALAGTLIVTSTGILLRYVLPHGSGGLEGRGHGFRAMQRPVATVWGWTRAEWGDLHTWISFAVLAVLAAHVLLHFKWIMCVLRGKPREGSGTRVAVGLVALVSLIAMAAAPLLAPKEVQPRQEILEQRGGEP